MGHDQAFNRESWKLFRKRKPVNFMSEKARNCRLNRVILGLVNRHEAERLLQAYSFDHSQWKSLCDEIEQRFINDGII